MGPAAYASLALELDQEGDSTIADNEIRWAIAYAPAEVSEVLRQMPARQKGKSRLDTLLYQLDAGIRARTLPQGNVPDTSTLLSAHAQRHEHGPERTDVSKDHPV